MDTLEDCYNEQTSCEAPGCKNYYNHETQQHQCETCGEYGHSQTVCPTIPVSLLCEICKQTYDSHHTSLCIYDPVKIAGSTEGKIYVLIDAGMGCFEFYKRGSVNEPFDKFVMHSDAWANMDSVMFLTY